MTTRFFSAETLSTSLRSMLRVSVLGLPVLLMGANANCDPWFPYPDACPAIAIECDDGFEAADTNGDGCTDGCVEIANCLALPVCNEGETQVDGPGDCLQDDAVCYEATLCGTTIWCTGPDAPQTFCGSNADCGDDEYCDLSACGGGCEPGMACAAICAGTCEESVVCPPVDFNCDEGEVAVDSNQDGCVDGCEAEVNCAAVPVCDEGDNEVDPDSCEVIDATCYDVTLCGTTITCAG